MTTEKQSIIISAEGLESEAFQDAKELYKREDLIITICDEGGSSKSPLSRFLHGNLFAGLIAAVFTVILTNQFSEKPVSEIVCVVSDSQVAKFSQEKSAVDIDLSDNQTSAVTVIDPVKIMDIND